MAWQKCGFSINADKLFLFIFTNILDHFGLNGYIMFYELVKVNAFTSKALKASKSNISNAEAMQFIPVV